MAEDRDYTTNRGTTDRDTTSRDQTLYRLNELSDYEVADHSPDIRGWEVKSRDGHTFGRVKDLIVDKVAMKVRYIDLELNNEFEVDSSRNDIHLLVPIGAARVDEDDDDVYVDRIMTHEELQRYPRSTRGPITREYERDVVNYHTGTATGVNTPGTSTGTTTTGTGQGTGSANDPIIPYDRDDDDNFYNQDCFRQENLYRNRRT